MHTSKKKFMRNKLILKKEVKLLRVFKVTFACLCAFRRKSFFFKVNSFLPSIVYQVKAKWIWTHTTSSSYREQFFFPEKNNLKLSWPWRRWLQSCRQRLQLEAQTVPPPHPGQKDKLNLAILLFIYLSISLYLSL